jgi:Protein of unknown function (DUF3833)
LIPLSITLAILAGAALAVALVVLLTRIRGFHTQKPADFATQTPIFDLKHHLNGPIICEGVIYGPMGRVASRFVADMHGSWHGDTGTLRETFHYDSGTVQDRCWTLTLTGNTIRAEAPDVPTPGTGTVTGSAVQMRYPIRLRPEAGGHVLHVTDWMYLMQNGTIMNRSQFTKFGITVAELVATMRPAKDTA